MWRVGTSLGISQVTTSAGQTPAADNDRAGVKGRKAKLEKRDECGGRRALLQEFCHLPSSLRPFLWQPGGAFKSYFSVTPCLLPLTLFTCSPSFWGP